MAAKGSFELDFSALQRAIIRVPNLTRVAVEDAMELIGDKFIEKMHARFTATLSGPYLSNNTKSKLANRSGDLRRSLGTRVVSNGGRTNDIQLRATIGDAATANYVFTQEYGATIRPKRASKLTVPLPDAMTSTGQARFSPRDVEGLFKLTLGTKEFLVAPGADGTLRFLWILKDQVKVPARLGFKSTFKSKGMREFGIARLNEGIYQALQLAGLDPKSR
tara:strand:+ start:642 stop:1301 length:660 start_codon:yes stop_codon:yes gene_type:complete